MIAVSEIKGRHLDGIQKRIHDYNFCYKDPPVILGLKEVMHHIKVAAFSELKWALYGSSLLIFQARYGISLLHNMIIFSVCLQTRGTNCKNLTVKTNKTLSEIHLIYY